MPYILTPLIRENSSGMWFEGAAYSKENIYKINPGQMPPVNYDKHILKPHSLTHIEAQKHVEAEGLVIEDYFAGNYFFGKCTVVRLKGNNFKKVTDEIYHWEVTLQQLKDHLCNKQPNKLLITIDDYKINSFGYQDPNFVLTLSQEAADWLVSNPNFNLYGTSWKSSDYKPKSAERPIHKTLFKQAAILENLDLKDVPDGEYFLNCFPLRLANASESPVTPVLFTKEEILEIF